MQIHMYCYPWDLRDEGLDEVLDRLYGEAGMTGISLATQYHRIDQLRPHAGKGPTRFRSEGGAQFQYDPAGYASTRMRPVAADWLGRSNPLRRMGEACRKRGMHLRAWHVCCHNPATVARYPDHAIQDVFGQRSTEWLCPADPDVREWLRCSLRDLTRQNTFDAVELEAACFPTRWRAGTAFKSGVELGPVDQWLTGLCFCASCRQAAMREDIDADRIAEEVRAHLARVFATGRATPGDVASFAAQQPALADFVACRQRQVSALVASIREDCPTRIVVHREGERFWGGVDFEALAKHGDALMVLFYEADPARMDEPVAAARGETGDIGRVELALSACTPPCASSETLVASMKRAVELGIRSVNISNYGLMPLARIDWLNHASRYARREAV